MAEPRVSVITIFLDEERFLAEAVESVLAQRYEDWELLLCDDGSTDGSTALARGFAARHPERIRYLEHPGHRNLGMSATRNLGLRHARGEFIAFLDADDIWLPNKLEVQTRALDAHPDVALVYGPSLYWHGWTGLDVDRSLDAHSRPAQRAGEVMAGTRVLRRVLRDRADALCTCALLVRRARLIEVGGFEDRFRGMFEDQAFLSKLLVEHRVLAVGECTDHYRQHADSTCWIANRSGVRTVESRLAFLRWLREYLHGRKVGFALRLALEFELLVHGVPGLAEARERWRDRRRRLTSRAMDATVRLGRRVLPNPMRQWLWRRLVVRESRSP